MCLLRPRLIVISQTHRKTSLTEATGRCEIVNFNCPGHASWLCGKLLQPFGPVPTRIAETCEGRREFIRENGHPVSPGIHCQGLALARTKAMRLRQRSTPERLSG